MNNDTYEQVKTTRTGDKALRRKKRQKGLRYFISQSIRKILKNEPAK